MGFLSRLPFSNQPLGSVGTEMIRVKEMLWMRMEKNHSLLLDPTRIEPDPTPRCWGFWTYGNSHEQCPHKMTSQ